MMTFRQRLAPPIVFLQNRLSRRGYLGLHLTLGMLAIILGCWWFGGIVEDLLTNDPLVQIDHDLALWFHQHGTPALTLVALFLTFFGFRRVHAAAACAASREPDLSRQPHPFFWSEAAASCSVHIIAEADRKIGRATIEAMRVCSAMMHEFLTANRTELIERCRAKVAQRSAPAPTEEEMEFGIPLFLDQLIKTLRAEEMADPRESRAVSGPSSGKPATSEIGTSAALHGRELLEKGFTVDQVVHDYGDLCQAVTGLAFELEAPMEVDEFRTLNRCLDNAIADAVTEFNYQRDLIATDENTHALNERLGFFAHEVRNLLNSAMLAVTAIKAGNVGVTGATGAVLDASLVGLRNLIDRSLAEVRITAGLPVQHRLFSLSDFIAEVTVAASLEAKLEKRGLTIGAVDRRLAVEADRDLLSSAVGNLLQNAFKYSRPHTEVSLKAYALADRIRIDVSDHCGGLPSGDPEKLFQPFTQGNDDKTGLGLGLSISRRGVEANQGTLSVRDIPGTGCIFTIDLPRHAMPESLFRVVAAA